MAVQLKKRLFFLPFLMMTNQDQRQKNPEAIHTRFDNP